MASDRRVELSFRTIEDEVLFWESHSSMDFEGVEVDPETLQPIGVELHRCAADPGLETVKMTANVFVWMSKPLNHLEPATTITSFQPSDQWLEYAGLK